MARLPERSYTPTQERILAVLADGEPHPASELWGCLGDELSNGNALNNHITVLRKLLPLGQLIINRQHKGVSYFQMGRLVAPGTAD